MAALPPPESKSLAVVSDGISALSYIPSGKPTYLAATSWDGTVQIHDTAAASSTTSSGSTTVLKQSMESGPLLSLATPYTKESLVTGGMDGSVKVLDYTTNAVRLLGAHGKTKGGSSGDESSSPTANACSCLASLSSKEYRDNDHLVVSASWNKEVCLWDTRTSSGPVSTAQLPGKAFSLDVDAGQSRVLIATAGRRNCVLDWRQGQLEQVLDRESSLKFQTRTVRFFPDGKGFALGSVEGRVGVEFLDELGVASNMKRYAFKCHRVNDTVYPVNCITFHPRFTSTFATGGCDGSVVLWDGLNKKKLTTIPTFPTSISAIAFNHDGSEMAVASSYTFEDGDREHPQDEIFVRQILDSECLPKPK